MTQSSSQTRIEDSSQVRARDVEDVGRRYRFEHLALPLVMKDLYFGRGDPEPGDRVPAFDLPIVWRRPVPVGGPRQDRPHPAGLWFGDLSRHGQRGAWAERVVLPLRRSRALRHGQRS